MFGNVESRFLPEPENRPLLTFGAPWIQYVYSRSVLNAAAELLDRSVERFGGERVAIHDAGEGEDWTYGRLSEAVNRLGNGLVASGLEPGERVLLRLPEVPEAAVAQLAVWKAGGIVVPSSTAEMVREIEFMLNDTEAAMAIVHADHLEELEKARGRCPGLREVIAVPEATGDYLSYGRLLQYSSGELEAFPNRPLDASGIYYTGGTTGHPKGCLHTHASEVVLADLNNLSRDAGPEDVFLTHAPIGHAFGNGEKINFPLRAGASTVYSPRPGARRMLELAEGYGATIMAGAATMYRMILRDVPHPREEFPGLVLRSALSSGEILDQKTYDRWPEEMGFEVRNSVGMTPMRHLFLDSNLLGQKLAPGLSVGTPMPGYEARLVDPLTAEPGSPGEVGRLAIRGPSGITYWINLHPTIRERAARDVKDGWSILDDAYKRDEDGWLWFECRLDDMIVTGGRQVAAPEVEAILSSHDAVSEAAVVAAPDEIRGQIVKAYVVLKPGSDPDQNMVELLQNHAKVEMAAYKYPRAIEFLDELPKDAVGKLQRRRLRERAARESSDVAQV